MATFQQLPLLPQLLQLLPHQTLLGCSLHPSLQHQQELHEQKLLLGNLRVEYHGDLCRAAQAGLLLLLLLCLLLHLLRNRQDSSSNSNSSWWLSAWVVVWMTHLVGSRSSR